MEAIAVSKITVIAPRSHRDRIAIALASAPGPRVRRRRIILTAT